MEEGMGKLNCGEEGRNEEDEEVRERKWVRKKPLKISRDNHPSTFG